MSGADHTRDWRTSASDAATRSSAVPATLPQAQGTAVPAPLAFAPHDAMQPRQAQHQARYQAPSERAAARDLAWTFAFVLAALAISGLYAAIECRGLYQDGAYYLYRIAEHESFYLVDPARTTVQAMRQAPAVLLTKFGSFSLVERAQAFSLAMLLMPVLLCAACWFIVPAGRKAAALLPMLFLLIGFTATSFNAVGEAAIAASYFWLLLLLLLFRTRHIASKALFLLLCVPATYLHEGTFLLTLMCFLACVVRLRSAAGWQEQAFLILAMGILLHIFIYQLGWVIEPRIPGGRETEFRALYKLQFLLADGRLNLQVVTGALAVAALGGIAVAQLKLPADRAMRHTRAIAASFVAAASVAVAAALFIEPTFAPRAQILARYHPVYVSTLLGVAAIFLGPPGILERLPLRLCCLLVIVPLCFAQVTGDVVATSRWHDFIVDLQSRLATSRGLLSWESTMTTGDPHRDLNWRLLNADWVVPMMSIIFAEGGVVKAMIDLPPDMTFRPLDPEKPDELPSLRGIDYGPYRRDFAAQDGRDAF